MTQVLYSGPGALYPATLAFLGTSVGLSTLATLDAGTEKVCIFGRYWWPDRADTSKNLTHVHVNIGTVASFNAASQWRVSVQGLAAASGPPAQPDASIAASFTSAAGVGPTATSMNRVALAAPLAVSFGALASIVIDYAAFTAASSFVVRGLTSSYTGLRGLQSSASENTSGSYVEAALQPILILEFDDGTFGTLYGSLPTTAYNSRAWSNTGSGSGGLTNGNQRGLEFVPEETFTADMVFADLTVAAGADFEILVLEGTTVLDTIVVDSNQIAVNSIRRAGFVLGGSRTFTAGQTYRILIRPTTANNITLQSLSVGNALHRTILGSTGFASNSRTDSGAFGAAVDTEIPAIFLAQSGLDNGAGGGGGGLIIVED
jgi:hypothetical protein